jgi:hypothetical protein
MGHENPKTLNGFPQTARARILIDDSAELGLEMFGLDAGWFRAVGDWHPDPKKFQNGLKAVSDAAHRRGLKIGLWVDWAQAGASKEASVECPRSQGSRLAGDGCT